jgi:hypothetical protein
MRMCSVAAPCGGHTLLHRKGLFLCLAQGLLQCLWGRVADCRARSSELRTDVAARSWSAVDEGAAAAPRRLLTCICIPRRPSRSSSRQLSRPGTGRLSIARSFERSRRPSQRPAFRMSRLSHLPATGAHVNLQLVQFANAKQFGFGACANINEGMLVYPCGVSESDSMVFQRSTTLTARARTRMPLTAPHGHRQRVGQLSQ